MPFLNLSGTPAPRRPDPPIRRVQPNGTQEFSSYQAWFCYYDVASAGYRFVLGFVESGSGDGLFTSVLLFGTDYPSIVSFFSQYETDTYDQFGVLNLIRNLSFPESLFPGLASFSGAPSFFSVFANPDETLTEYKEITPRVGVTITNNVEVQGFPYFAVTQNRGLWHSSEGQDGERAAFSLQANVTLNGATTHSTSAFVDIAGQSIRIPVILYEPDFTQAIKDNQYILKDVPVYDTLFEDELSYIIADLDVVGIFTGAGYAPTPPTPPDPPTPFSNFPYNTYQAKFAYVEDGGTAVSIVDFPSTGQPVEGADPWPITMLLFCSGAPTIINQRLDFGEGASNLGVDGLYIANQSPPLAAGYTQIPITTQQNLAAELMQTDLGVILSGSPYASYQQRVTGLTVTHAAEASGYFAQAFPTKNETIYYYNLSEETFEYAVAEMNIDVIGESGEVIGPSNYRDKSENRVIPIIVNEDTFGTYNIDNGTTGNIPYSFGIGTDYYVVVGIWAYPAPKEVVVAAPFSALESVENSPPLPPAAKAREDYKANFPEALKFKKRSDRP
jgi:hypothetical protein